jgi:hypothetical protein
MEGRGEEVTPSNLGDRTKVSEETAASTFRVCHDEDEIKKNQTSMGYYKPLLKHKHSGHYMYHLL